MNVDILPPRAPMRTRQKQECPICAQWARADATVCKHCLGYLAPLPLPVTMPVPTPAAPRRSVSYASPTPTPFTRRPTVNVLVLACIAGVAFVAALVGGIWWLRPTTATQISVAAARISESVTSGSANKTPPPFTIAPTVPIENAARSQPALVVVPLPRPRPRKTTGVTGGN